MNPNIWGKSFWVFLLYIVSNYGTIYGQNGYPLFDEVHRMHRFLNIIGYILPCKKTCSINYYKNIQIYPIENYIQTRNTLTKWLYEMNNLIRSENSQEPITFDQFIEKYSVGQLETMNHIKKTLIYVAKEYPLKPCFDDIMQYKNFYSYLKSLNAIKNFDIYMDMYPIDNYLTNRKLLLDWILMFYKQPCNKYLTITPYPQTTELFSKVSQSEYNILYVALVASIGLGTFYLYKEYLK